MEHFYSVCGGQHYHLTNINMPIISEFLHIYSILDFHRIGNKLSIQQATENTEIKQKMRHFYFSETQAYRPTANPNHKKRFFTFQVYLMLDTWSEWWFLCPLFFQLYHRSIVLTSLITNTCFCLRDAHIHNTWLIQKPSSKPKYRLLSEVSSLFSTVWLLNHFPCFITTWQSCMIQKL